MKFQHDLSNRALFIYSSLRFRTGAGERKDRRAARTYWFDGTTQTGCRAYLQHRAEPLVAEDQVVEYPDAEQLARLQQPLRDMDIVAAGDEDAAGMVVCDYDRCSPFPERIAEDPPPVH